MASHTSMAAGWLVVAVLAAVAEWERGVMLERTRGDSGRTAGGTRPKTKVWLDSVPERGGAPDAGRGQQRARHRLRAGRR